MQLKAKQMKYDETNAAKVWVFPNIGVPPRFSIINHPFWGTRIFGNTRIEDRQPEIVLQFALANWNLCWPNAKT